MKAFFDPFFETFITYPTLTVLVVIGGGIVGGLVAYFQRNRA